MKAARAYSYGSPEVVTVEEVERPSPVADQLLVRVHAASVNRADLDGLIPRPSFVRLFMGMRAPRNHRVGIDAAGVVEAVGPGATRFSRGTGSSRTCSRSVAGRSRSTSLRRSGRSRPSRRG